MLQRFLATARGWFPWVALAVLTAMWTDSASASVRITEMVNASPAHAKAGARLVFLVEGLEAPAQVFFSDGFEATIPAAEVHSDVERGLVLVTVPSGARTGDVLLESAGLTSLPFFFRVDDGAFAPGARTVSGSVLAGKTPVAGVAVVLVRKNECGGETVWNHGRTGENGRYDLGAESGKYRVMVFPPVGSGLTAGFSEIWVGASSVERNVELTSGTAVTGRVVRAKAVGEGVPRARLGFSGPTSMETLVADDNGDFRAFLPAGALSLDVAPPSGEALMSLRRMGVTVLHDSPQTLGDLALPAGIRIAGSLRRKSDGLPLAGAVVTASTDGSPSSALDRKASGGDGSFTLVVAPGHTYFVTAAFERDARFADADAPPVAVVAADVVVNLEAADASFLEGTVTDRKSGSPLPGIEVQASPALLAGSVVTRTQTCSNGSYRLRVPASDTGYRITAGGNGDAARGFVPVTWDKSERGSLYACEGYPVPAPEAGRSVTGLDLSLPVGAAAVSGDIAAWGSGCALPEDGISRVTVDDGTDHACGLGILDPYTGPGSYRVHGLPPADLVASLRVCLRTSDGSVLQCWDRRAPQSYVPVVLRAGTAVDGVNFCTDDAGMRPPVRLRVQSHSAGAGRLPGPDRALGTATCVRGASRRRGDSSGRWIGRSSAERAARSMSRLPGCRRIGPPPPAPAPRCPGRIEERGAAHLSNLSAPPPPQRKRRATGSPGARRLSF